MRDLVKHIVMVDILCAVSLVCESSTILQLRLVCGALYHYMIAQVDKTQSLISMLGRCDVSGLLWWINNTTPRINDYEHIKKMDFTHILRTSYETMLCITNIVRSSGKHATKYNRALWNACAHNNDDRLILAHRVKPLYDCVPGKVNDMIRRCVDLGRDRVYVATTNMIRPFHIVDVDMAGDLLHISNTYHARSRNGCTSRHELDALVNMFKYVNHRWPHILATSGFYGHALSAALLRVCGVDAEINPRLVLK